MSNVGLLLDFHAGWVPPRQLYSGSEGFFKVLHCY